MWPLLLFTIIASVYANTECVWVIGQVVCQKDPTAVQNTVVEVWDKDGPEKFALVDSLDPDDMAGLTVIDNENGLFKVEGCASDVDWLGPLHKNRPEFYLKIRHRCNASDWIEKIIFPKVNIYAPVTLDEFMETPIVLDA